VLAAQDRANAKSEKVTGTWTEEGCRACRIWLCSLAFLGSTGPATRTAWSWSMCRPAPLPWAAHCPYTADPQTKPVVDEGSRDRILHGGSWDLDPAVLRATTRNWGSATASSDVSGFRRVVA
jgi:hypothetical protein